MLCYNTEMLLFEKYLFLANVLVGLVFKPLLDTSKRHVPVILGNILVETEGRQRPEEKEKRGEERAQFDPLYLLHLYNNGDKSH